LKRFRMINKIKLFSSALETSYKSLKILESIAESKPTDEAKFDELEELLAKEIRVDSLISNDNERIEKQITLLKKRRFFTEQVKKALFFRVMKKQQRIYMMKRDKSHKILGIKQNNKKSALSDFYCSK
jgi:hypothetical protein